MIDWRAAMSRATRRSGVNISERAKSVSKAVFAVLSVTPSEDQSKEVDPYFDREGSSEMRKGATQMIFADLGIGPQRGFSAYEHIRCELISRGVPASDIGFMQDYEKSEDKIRLFHEMSSSRLRSRSIRSTTERFG
jgi:hypothetical protein